MPCICQANCKLVNLKAHASKQLRPADFAWNGMAQIPLQGQPKDTMRHPF
jgi:hypothetical protein